LFLKFIYVTIRIQHSRPESIVKKNGKEGNQIYRSKF